MDKDSNSKKYRIGMTGVIFLIAFAVLSDLLSLIPFVGGFVGPLYWTLVSIYLWKVGCGFLRINQLVTKAISVVAEIIPWIQALPTILAGTVAIIIMIRMEDKTGLRLSSPASRAPMRRVPLNIEGVRSPQ